MNNLLSIERALISAVGNSLGIAVFANVPYDYMPPYVEIADIETSGWLISPESSAVNLTVKIYSGNNSNAEVIEQFSKAKQAILELNLEGLVNQIIGWESCYLDKNSNWVAEAEVKLYIMKEAESD
jgi:hypothetical protein